MLGKLMDIIHWVIGICVIPLGLWTLMDVTRPDWYIREAFEVPIGYIHPCGFIIFCVTGVNYI